MNLKTLIIAGVASTAAFTVGAEDFSSVLVEQRDGSQRCFSAEGFEMTFSDGLALITNGKTSANIPLSALASIAFSSAQAAIPTLSATQTTIDVYSIAGVFLGRYNSEEEARAALGSGIYVIKSAAATKTVLL